MRASAEIAKLLSEPPVAMRKVPPIARMIEIASCHTGSFLLLRQVKTRIIAGERYCRTVAMPAFESSIARKYENWHITRPSRVKRSITAIFFLPFHTPRIFPLFFTVQTMRSISPEKSILIGTSQLEVAPHSEKIY